MTLPDWLRPYTASSLAEEQRNAPFTRWHHMARMLKVLEIAHETAQAARWSRYRSEVAREAELLPSTVEHVWEHWRKREAELSKLRKPRVIVPIPPRAKEKAS